MSTYNFRKYGDGDSSFAQFLNDSRSAFGVPADTHYRAGNHEIYQHFASDISRSYIGDVVAILKTGTRFLIYNGQDDFVVNIEMLH